MPNINDTLKWLDDVCNMYAVGKEVYDMCKDTLKSMPGAEMIVSSANLGDTVFIATLSEAYKRVHGIKTLLIVARDRQAAAAEWFEGVDNVVGIGNTEMICLRYYFTVSRKFYENGIRSENADKYRDAVLIAPAAFTNQGIPDSFWENLVEWVRGEGFKVYCNSGGLHYDKMIGGCEEFAAGTKELILDAPLFRHVIAVRSGFTDLVSKTDARLTVLHLGAPEDSVSRVEYGTRGDDVRDLGRMEGIFPVVHVPGKEEELINLIMEDVGQKRT